MKLMEIKITCVIADNNYIDKLIRIIQNGLKVLSPYFNISHRAKVNFNNEIEICGVKFKPGYVFKNNETFIDKIDKRKKKLVNSARDIRFVVYSVGTKYIKIIEISKGMLNNVLSLSIEDISKLEMDNMCLHYYVIMNDKIALVDGVYFFYGSDDASKEEIINNSKTNDWEREACTVKYSILQLLFDRIKNRP